VSGSYLDAAGAALQTLDTEALVALYADGFAFEDPGLGQTVRTRDELRAYFEGLFGWADASFRDVEVFSCGSRGAAEWTWSGTSPVSNRRFSIRGASIFEVGASGITRETIYYDPRPALGR
jgi:steroid delta-isomerase-like uncharacterized protein